VVVPRFLSHLITEDDPYPLGETAWGDTVIELPEDGGGATTGSSYRNIFTDESHAVNETAARALPLAAVFQRFPVALLEWRSNPPKK